MNKRIPNRKRGTELSVQSKKELIDLSDSGFTNRSLAQIFGIGKSTVGSIKKNRELILRTYEDDRLRSRKRKRHRNYNEIIDVKVREFFEACKANNILITGSLLQGKAREVAEEFNIEKFRASNGWLEGFKRRNNLSLTNQSLGNPVDADMAGDCEDDFNIADYSPEDIFNATETEFFFDQAREVNPVPKENSAEGSKFFKEKLCAMFCCSASGEKLKPLVIVSRAQSDIFKNDVSILELPAICEFDKEARMSINIFNFWVSALDDKMRKDDRKVLLIVKNSPEYDTQNKLTNVRIKLIPAEDQPLEQGIINALKLSYRKKRLLCIASNLETCSTLDEFKNQVTVADAIHWLNNVWNEVSQESILKCYYSAGVLLDIPVTLEDSDDSDSEVENIMDFLPDDIRNEILMDDVSDNVKTENLDEDDVVERSLKMLEEADEQDEKSYNECEPYVKPSPPTPKKALEHIARLIQYSNAHQPELKEDFFVLYKKIEKKWVETRMKTRSSKDSIN